MLDVSKLTLSGELGTRQVFLVIRKGVSDGIIISHFSLPIPLSSPLNLILESQPRRYLLLWRDSPASSLRTLQALFLHGDAEKMTRAQLCPSGLLSISFIISISISISNLHALCKFIDVFKL